MASDCVFCRIVSGLLPAAVVSETPTLLAIMDRYPATRGHMLILPKQHIENLYGMPDQLAASLMAQATALAKVMQRQLAPAGLNLIQANGTPAGQTIEHFHMHLVPRYANDGVSLHFGHGEAPADMDALESIASVLRRGFE
jgi:histidine triad (HIT) family protein